MLEIQAVTTVQDHHLKGIRALREENLLRHAWVVSLDSHRRRAADGIDFLPWRELLSALWTEELFKREL